MVKKTDVIVYVAVDTETGEYLSNRDGNPCYMSQGGANLSINHYKKWCARIPSRGDGNNMVVKKMKLVEVE